VIKAHLNEFLRETLQLKHSEEKTLITNAWTPSARFLGDEVVYQHADDQPYRAQHRRGIDGVPGLKIPEAVLRATCVTYMRRGQAFHLAACINDADDRLVT
jgi:hypothetical protein